MSLLLIGTVEDVHDIGKTIVASMLSASGFDVIDLGIDVSTEKFVETCGNEAGICRAERPLTSTMPKQKTVIEAFENSRVKGRCQSICGRSTCYRILGEKHWCRLLCPGCRSRCEDSQETNWVKGETSNDPN